VLVRPEYQRQGDHELGSPPVVRTGRCWRAFRDRPRNLLSLTWLLYTLVKQASFVRDVRFPDAVAIECLDYFRYVAPVSLVLEFKRTENTVRCGAYARQKHCGTFLRSAIEVGRYLVVVPFATKSFPVGGNFSTES